MKNVGENEANRFCFVLTLWLSGNVMVEVNGAYTYGKYEKNLVEQFPCNVQR